MSKTEKKSETVWTRPRRNATDVYHTDKDCHALKRKSTNDPRPVDKNQLGTRFRECQYCAGKFRGSTERGFDQKEAEISDSAPVNRLRELTMAEQIAIAILQDDGWGDGELAMCFNVGKSSIERLDPSKQVKDVAALADHVTPDGPLDQPADPQTPIPELVSAYKRACEKAGVDGMLPQSEYEQHKQSDDPSVHAFRNRWNKWTTARKQVERRL